MDFGMIVAGMTMNASVGAMEMYGAPFMNNLSWEILVQLRDTITEGVNHLRKITDDASKTGTGTF